MKSRRYIIFLIYLLVIIILFSILFFPHYSNKKKVLSNISIATLSNPPSDYDARLDKIRDLTVQVHNNHTYSYNDALFGGVKWTCLEYAKELTFILKENNFDATCVFGNYDSINVSEGQVHLAHNWVIVIYNDKFIGLDPTFGTWYLNYSEYKLHYNQLSDRCL